MPAYLNLSLRAWRQLGRNWGLPQSHSLARRTWVYGSYCSAAAAVQRAVTGARRRAMPKDGAIVLVGFWRSGTTLLHELLCCDDRFGYPTTYACLNPHHFILTQRRALARNRGRVQRVQDRMMIGLDSPQEDEFALLSLGARSPYEGLLAAGGFREAFRLADPNELSDVEAQTWRARFLEFYGGVSLINGGKPLILKSPAHSYRVSTLRQLLPEARFILITRNPYEVFESMVRTYRSLSQKYGLGVPLSDDEVRETILAERIRFETKLVDGLAGLPPNRYASIRYEDLIQSPVAVIEALYDELDLPPFAPVRKRLIAEVAKRAGHLRDATKPDPTWSKRLRDEWASLFDRYGYPREIATSA